MERTRTEGLPQEANVRDPLLLHAACAHIHLPSAVRSMLHPLHLENPVNALRFHDPLSWSGALAEFEKLRKGASYGKTGWPHCSSTPSRIVKNPLALRILLNETHLDDLVREESERPSLGKAEEHAGSLRSVPQPFLMDAIKYGDTPNDVTPDGVAHTVRNPVCPTFLEIRSCSLHCQWSHVPGLQ